MQCCNIIYIFKNFEKNRATKYWPDTPQIVLHTLLIKYNLQEDAITWGTFSAQYWARDLDVLIFAIICSFFLAYRLIALFAIIFTACLITYENL